jgi:hypothetical protein
MDGHDIENDRAITAQASTAAAAAVDPATHAAEETRRLAEIDGEIALCMPAMRTPFCGKPGCEWPAQKPSAVTPPRASEAGRIKALRLVRDLGWAANPGRQSIEAIGVAFDEFHAEQTALNNAEREAA